MRCVSRTGSKVHEERLLGGQRLLRSHPRDRLCRHIGREVVVLLLLGLAHRSRSMDNHRIPLVGLTADEAVELVKARSGWPAIEGTALANFPRWRLVVLAPGRCGIAVHAKNFGHRSDALRPYSCVARKCGGDLHDRSGIVAVVVVPGEQRSPRGTAKGSGMKAVVLQTVVGEFLQIRHQARSTKGARMPKSDVVDQDHHDVGSSLGSFHVPPWRSLRIPCIELGIDG